jgi:hypothetical protein
VSIEEELPRLLNELADDHVVGPPPGLEQHVVRASRRNRARPALLTAALVAACSVVVVGGLVAIGTRDGDPAPAIPPPATDDSQSDSPVASTPTSDPTVVDTTTEATAVESADTGLDLIRIDARASAQGTTRVALVFDGEVPSSVSPELLSSPTAPPSDRIGYITQSSGESASGISVCGDSHWFPAPGNRTVDIFVPSDWFGPESVIDPPVELEPGSAALPKIVVCEPLNGAVQISVWGAASGRAEDVNVSVDASTIVVNIAPDPLDRSVDSASAVDGPVMRHPNRSGTAEGLAAEVRGVLELEQDCLYIALDEVGERYPILWPALTTWNPDANTVVLPLGQSVAIGDSVYGGGGYFYVDDIERLAGKEAAELAGRCVDNQYGEIAVVNNYDSAISPD